MQSHFHVIFESTPTTVLRLCCGCVVLSSGLSQIENVFEDISRVIVDSWVFQGYFEEHFKVYQDTSRVFQVFLWVFEWGL